MGWFRRGSAQDEKNLDALLAEARSATPPPIAPTAPTDDDDEEDDAGERAPDPLLMPIADVFSITGRGTIVTGRIEAGTVRVGDKVSIRHADGTVTESEVGGIDKFRRMNSTEGSAGENVGLLLRGVAKDAVRPGAAITA